MSVRHLKKKLTSLQSKSREFELAIGRHADHPGKSAILIIEDGTPALRWYFTPAEWDDFDARMRKSLAVAAQSVS